MHDNLKSCIKYYWWTNLFMIVPVKTQWVVYVFGDTLSAKHDLVCLKALKEGLRWSNVIMT